MNNTAQIYNKLFRAEKQRRKGAIPKAYPVHKEIKFRHQSLQDISDWLLAELKIADDAHILDAGCGVGYTLMSLCRQSSRSGTGISLSRREVEYARKVALSAQLNNRCEFREQSFDQPLSKSFDLIIAIESIKHAISYENTLSNLLQHLKPGGQFVIIDDFITDYAPLFIIRPIRKYWSVPGLFNAQEVINCVDKIGSFTYQEVDFSNQIAFRSRKLLLPKMIIAFILTWLFALFQKYNVMGIIYAGLCLEWLYHKEKMEYKAIIFKKSIQ
ncbi:MAG: methyltransferase domain-containing protein [Bacteroidetes bacterium]|jgi:SAM-dependent methyltransferase|nr:methyltransferase domain-containing protein [Bacteroidota bacterium]